jgi:hypothetical protein
MLFYRFHDAGGSMVALTNDITGSNLPKSESVWRADGQTEIREGGSLRLGVNPKEIIATIGREGLFVGSARRF